MQLNPGVTGRRVVVVSGVVAAHAREVFQDIGIWDRIPLFQVLQPFPLHTNFIQYLRGSCESLLVIEETTGVIEMQIADHHRVHGKTSGAVPSVGELSPETVERVICRYMDLSEPQAVPEAAPGRRPTLCAGCPHRASFFAIKKAVPRGIYTSDIGCYTLGLNLGAVHTVLCMGAAVSQAAGFYHAHKHLEKPPDIVATIGDSTFFHAGVPALIDAVSQNVRFVLVILDNRTTAMTGNQPTPATMDGTGAIDLETLVQGCGVTFCRVADPYNVEDFIALLKEAVEYSRSNGPAVGWPAIPVFLTEHRRTPRERRSVCRSPKIVTGAGIVSSISSVRP